MRYAALLAALLMPLALAASCGSSGGKKAADFPSAEESAANNAEMMLHSGNIKGAKWKMKAALAGFQKTDNLPKIAETYIRLGHIAMMEGDFKAAGNYIASAKTISEIEGYKDIMGESILAEASLLLAQNKPDDALKSLGSLEKAGKQSIKIRTENIRGRARMALNDYEGAEKSFAKALDASRSAKYASGAAAALANIGTLHLKMKEYQKAVQYLKESLAIERESGSAFSIGDTLHLIGNAYEAAGDAKNALYHYNRALNVNIHLDAPKRVEADRRAIERVEKGL